MSENEGIPWFLCQRTKEFLGSRTEEIPEIPWFQNQGNFGQSRSENQGKFLGSKIPRFQNQGILKFLGSRTEEFLDCRDRRTEEF